MERRRSLIPTTAILGWSLAFAATLGVAYGLVLLALSGHVAVGVRGGVTVAAASFFLLGSGLMWLSRSSRGRLLLLTGKVRPRGKRLWSAVVAAVLMGTVAVTQTGSLLRGALVAGAIASLVLGAGGVMFLAWRRQIRPLIGSRDVRTLGS